jgi:hypothetical protein
VTISEYATSILSIVLGLGVAHLLGGLAWFVRRVQLDLATWLFAGWCLTLLLVMIGWWWAIWVLFDGLESLAFLEFLPALLVSTLLYMASRVLVPEVEGLVAGVKVHFLSIRKPFFGILFAVFLSAFFLSSSAAGGFAVYLMTLEGLLEIPLLLLALAGMFQTTLRQHSILWITWTTLYLSQQLIQPGLGGASA